MADSNGNNGKHGIRVWIPVIVAIVGAFGAGTGANYLLVSNTGTLQEIARPDPFTGTEAKVILEDIKQLKRDILDLRLAVDRLPPRELLDRLIELEVKVSKLEREVDKNH